MQRVALAIHHSEVILEEGFLYSDEVIEVLKPISTKFALFCDTHVAELIGSKWCIYLNEKELDVSLFTFPPGEHEKNRERKASLEDQLLSQGFGREVCIVALGGGVTTDLIGFLAATFCRGVPLVHIPTTLLGMVDAAIGGKTGVNTPFGKNLIGAFYSAQNIFIDPTVLSTLPTQEWINGMAEVIKYGLIRSQPLFASLKTDRNFYKSVISECISIKGEVVEADFNESTGLRRILNFGHTIGHALEHVENYTLSHGEAVAMGMLVESYLSHHMGLLSSQEFEEIQQIIRSFPFQLTLSSRVTIEKVGSAILLDKKGSGQFVLLEKIGSCHPFEGKYTTQVSPMLLQNALQWMIEEFGVIE
jgi:3-dehydroquinate synthase